MQTLHFSNMNMNTINSSFLFEHLILSLILKEQVLVVVSPLSLQLRLVYLPLLYLDLVPSFLVTPQILPSAYRISMSEFSILYRIETIQVVLGVVLVNTRKRSAMHPLAICLVVIVCGEGKNDTGYCYFSDSFGVDLMLIPFLFFLPISLSTTIFMFYRIH